MGGRGSGRRPEFGATCEDYRTIDVGGFARENLLRPGCRGKWQWFRDGEVTAYINVEIGVGRMVLSYRVRSPGEDWEDVEQAVPLCYTPLHYGGVRPWFMCPGCDRRCAILYGGARFLCRKCLGLGYRSQRESPIDRLLDRAQALRVRLGGSANMTTMFPPRPRGMHKRTYARLRAHGKAIEAALYGTMAKKFGVRGFF